MCSSPPRFDSHQTQVLTFSFPNKLVMLSLMMSGPLMFYRSNSRNSVIHMWKVLHTKYLRDDIEALEDVFHRHWRCCQRHNALPTQHKGRVQAKRTVSRALLLWQRCAIDQSFLFYFILAEWRHDNRLVMPHRVHRFVGDVDAPPVLVVCNSIERFGLTR
jgi:hypothetical protein